MRSELSHLRLVARMGLFRCLIVAASVSIFGCARATTTTSSVEKFESAEAQIEFFEDLERSHVVSNNDALHAFFLLADKDDGWRTYEARVAEAKRRGWISDSFDEPSTESAEVAWIATASCKIAKIRGGLTMMIVGPIPRYAVRELTNEQILLGKKPNQSFSGLEFVDYLTRLGRMARLNGGSILERVPEEARNQGTQAKPLPPVGRFE